MLVPAGRLVDRYQARYIALAGLAVFALGAALGAVSSDMALLLLSRVVQGAGAGLVSPAALAGAVSGFPPARRGAALGIWGASAGVANLIGPLLGGILTVVFGWRANWWALVPLAIISAVAVARFLPVLERTEEPGSAKPVLNQVVMAATVVVGLTFAVMIGTFYLAEQYLQREAGYSALGASSVLVLVALLVAFGAPVAGRLVDTQGGAVHSAARVHRDRRRARSARGPVRCPARTVHRARAAARRLRSRDAVRPALTRRAQLESELGARPDLGGAVGRAPARRRDRRRSRGRGDRVIGTDSLDDSHDAPVRVRALRVRRYPGIDAARFGQGASGGGPVISGGSGPSLSACSEAIAAALAAGVIT